ncbi:outer membrane beta-barrel protein [Roseivirga sp. BDSF3-8]|uniref:outer membrane beta-barrel protein n=1 Tax=Roseivirga sp. BDSF3-8 TaxID=3241598 RepID=UPI003531CBF9
MKKIVILSLFLLAGASSYAQFFTIGPRVGLSSSDLKLRETTLENGDVIRSGEPKAGFHAGMFTRITVGNFFIQPEALFTQAGGEIELNGNGFKEVFKLDYNRLDIPVLMGAKFGPVRIEGGPVASLMLSDDQKLWDDVSANFKESTLGYQVGVGFDVANVIIDFKYEGNLEKFGTIGGFETDARSSQFIASVGFKIF